MGSNVAVAAVTAAAAFFVLEMAGEAVSTVSGESTRCKCELARVQQDKGEATDGRALGPTRFLILTSDPRKGEGEGSSAGWSSMFAPGRVASTPPGTCSSTTCGAPCRLVNIEGGLRQRRIVG
jgi:hypothetical protein